MFTKGEIKVFKEKNVDDQMSRNLVHVVLVQTPRFAALSVDIYNTRHNFVILHSLVINLKW